MSDPQTAEQVIIGPWEVRQVPGHAGPLGNWFVIDRARQIHEMVCRTQAEAVAWAQRTAPSPSLPRTGPSHPLTAEPRRESGAPRAPVPN